MREKNKKHRKQTIWESLLLLILKNGMVIIWLVSVFTFLLGILLLCFDRVSPGTKCFIGGFLSLLVLPIPKRKKDSEETSSLTAIVQRRRQKRNRVFSVLIRMCLLILFLVIFGMLMIAVYNRTYYGPEYLEMGLAAFTLAAMLLAGTFTYVCVQLIRSNCTVGLTGRPDEDIIIRDGIRIAWSNPFRFVLITPLVIGILCWLRYADRTGSWLGILVLFIGALWAVSLFRGFLLSSRMRKGEWELRSDELIEKYIPYERDLDSYRRHSYFLRFKSKDVNWITSTTSEKFSAAQVGTYRWTAYLNGRKNPLFYYDINGDATHV